MDSLLQLMLAFGGAFVSVCLFGGVLAFAEKLRYYAIPSATLSLSNAADALRAAIKFLFSSLIILCLIFAHPACPALAEDPRAWVFTICIHCTRTEWDLCTSVTLISG